MIFAYYPPWETYHPVHDFLDSMFVLQSLSARTPILFDSEIPEVLGGISTNSLGLNSFSVENLAYRFLDPFLAASFNEVSSRSIGFLGMNFLLRLLFSEYDKIKFLSPIVAFSFSTLPYWPSVSYTVGLYPLALALLYLYLARDVSYKVLFPYCAVVFNLNFTYGGWILLVVLFSALMISIVHVQFRTHLRPMFILTMVSVAISALANLRLISLFLSDFQSHRLEWNAPQSNWFSTQSIKELLREYFGFLTVGQYSFNHGPTFHLIPTAQTIFIVISVLVSFFYILTSSRGYSEQISQLIKYQIIVLGVFLFIGIAFASETSGFTQFSYIPEVPFQFARIVGLAPLLYSLLFCISLLILFSHKSRLGHWQGIAIIFFIVFLQSLLLLYPAKEKIFHFIDDKRASKNISEYLDTLNYQNIRISINDSSKNALAVSFQLDPMVASFNGINSLDGYSYNYPLVKKQQFSRVISKVLETNQSLSEYFYGWGSRLYLFSIANDSSELMIDWCAANKLGVKFVLSGKKMDNVGNLSLLGKFSYVYVYRLDNCSI
jgi:hypothetical protein